MIPPILWKWRGLAGHLCVARDCVFHLCTDIGKYRISTVGAYYPNRNYKMETIGLNRHYETMVFRINKKGKIIGDEVDFDAVERKKKQSPYECDKLAEKMHIKMCYKYSNVRKRKEK